MEIYVYTSKAIWKRGREGTIKCGCGAELDFSLPLEFGGKAGVMTAEDAFVASINMSFATTFFSYAEKEKIDLIEFECDTNGILDRTAPKTMFKRLVIHPKITVGKYEDVEKVSKIVELSQKYSNICNSVKGKVVVEFKVDVQEKK